MALQQQTLDAIVQACIKNGVNFNCSFCNRVGTRLPIGISGIDYPEIPSQQTAAREKVVVLACRNCGALTHHDSRLLAD
jgi:hypothetical protein